MIDPERIEEWRARIGGLWPLLLRTVALLLLLGLDRLLPSTDWLPEGTRTSFVWAARFVVLAVALMLMVAAIVLQGRITVRIWLATAPVLALATLIVWLNYARYRDDNTITLYGNTQVLGRELTKLASSLTRPEDFTNHVKSRLSDALNDQFLMSKDPNRALEDQLNVQPLVGGLRDNQTQGVDRIFTQSSIDSMTYRLEWGYVVLASLFAACIASIVNLLCGLAPASMLPPIPVRGGVFISYRREDSGYACDSIRRELALRIDPEKIFVDQFSIEPGEIFDEEIARSVAGCDVFLEIIGRSWLTIANARGLRLDDPADFVRREIEGALRGEVPIIPVLVDGASMPADEDLPPAIGRLARHNAIPVRRGLDFNPDMRRLGDAIAVYAKRRRTVNQS